MKPTSDTVPPREPSPAGGHLAQLLERARPGVESLRRRQPSRFEPVQPWAGPAVADAVDARAAPALRSDLPAEQTPPAAPKVDRAASPPSSEKTARHPDAIPTVTEVHRHEWRLLRETLRVDRTIVTPASAAPIIQHQVREAPVATHASADGHAQAAAPRREADEAQPARPSPRRTPIEPSERPRSPFPPKDEVAAPIAAPLLRTPPTPTIRPPEQKASTARTATAVSTLRPRQATAASTIADRPTPTPTPIQVTIGRIEVRAVSAPPAPTASRRTAPRLSLEKYLTDRHGGQG